MKQLFEFGSVKKKTTIFLCSQNNAVFKNADEANKYREKPELMPAESTPDAAELATAS